MLMIEIQYILYHEQELPSLLFLLKANTDLVIWRHQMSHLFLCISFCSDKFT